MSVCVIAPLYYLFVVHEVILHIRIVLLCLFQLPNTVVIIIYQLIKGNWEYLAKKQTTTAFYVRSYFAKFSGNLYICIVGISDQ